MKTVIILILTLAALTTAATAQVTLSPLNAEFGKKAKGEFNLTNGTFAPLSVTFELQSVELSSGKFAMVDLKPTTHVKLSEYSARIPAKQTRTIAYTVTCDVMPCGVVILSTMATGHTNEGIAMATRMGTIAYVCDKQKGCRDWFLAQNK
jgi:hypothetical protein